MGMFDYVNYEADCPVCGEKLTEWQTKDSECFLETVSPVEVRRFYIMCKKCEAWVDAKVVVKEYDVVLSFRKNRPPKASELLEEDGRPTRPIKENAVKRRKKTSVKI